MKKILLTLSVILSVFMMSGCNTVSGFGKDLSSGGKAISTSSEKVQGS